MSTATPNYGLVKPTEATDFVDIDVINSNMDIIDTQMKANADLINLVYPVGSIYMATVATNPNTLFGVGTWTRWGQGRVPVSLDTGQTEFNTVEKIGGEKTHVLTDAEMPSHTHSINHTHTSDSRESGPGPQTNKAALAGGIGTEHTDATFVNTFSGNSGNAGSDNAHNNLQPYITCYMWKRIA